MSKRPMTMTHVIFTMTDHSCLNNYEEQITSIT